MNSRSANTPMPVQPPPDAVDAELSPLMSEPFAQGYARAHDSRAAGVAVRSRLLQRVATSHEAEAVMHTVRRRRAPREVPLPGVTLQTLYAAQSGRPARAGEPLRVLLIELAPGVPFDTAQLGAEGRSRHREWLVLAGQASADGEPLALRDYHVRPAGTPQPVLQSDEGALLFMRECELPAQGETVHTVRDADAGWPAFVPGIRRRVLWSRQGQAALLYHADPGASVPVHTHGHDEECLMVQGELFLDDLLLQPGDYQLAPQGSGHRITETDTGVVIYAHGDLDLRFT